MGFSLSDFAQEKLADINPFDNGQTGATIRANRKKKPAPAVTPPANTTTRPKPGGFKLAPQQNPAAALSPTVHPLNIPASNPSAITKPAAPAPAAPTSPYASEYKGLDNTDWNKAANNVGRFFLSGTSKLVNQGLGIVENTGGNIASAVTGNQQIKADVKKHVDQNLLADGKGLFNNGAIYHSTDELHNAKPEDVAVRAGGTGVQALTERLAPDLIKPLVKAGKPVIDKVLNSSLSGSLFAATNNAGSQLSEKGSIDPGEVLVSGMGGAIVGGAIPGATEGASKLAQFGFNKLRGATQQTAEQSGSKLAAVAKSRQQQPQPESPGIQVQPDAPVVPRPQEPSAQPVRPVEPLQPIHNVAPAPIREEGAPIPSHVVDYAQSAKNPGEVVKDAADYWYKHGKETKGGQLIDTAGEMDAYGSGYKRISDHNQFYSDYDKANKRAPSKAAYAEEVQRQLENGGGSMVDADQSLAYKLVKQRTMDDEAVNSSRFDPTDFEDFINQKEATAAEQRPVFDPNAPRKESRFANKTVQNSDEVSDPLKKLVKDEGTSYETTTNQDRIDAADAELAGKSNEESYLHVIKKLENKNFETKGQDSVTAIQVAKKLDALGGEDNHMMATEIYGQLSERFSKAGQEVQAASMLAARTPEGMRYGATRDLHKAGVDITPEISNDLQKFTDEIAKTTEGSDARKLAIGKLAQYVSKKIPNGSASNLVSVWKAGLLSGAKTTEGNILSNATFATIKKVSDPITVVADKAMSLITGKRSATLTQRGTVKGTVEGFRNGLTTLRTGVDLRTAADKYEQRAGINFKNPVVQSVLGKAQKVFDFMSAQDQPFYYSNLKNSLYDQAEAAWKNKPLNAGNKDEFIDNFVANPSEDVMQRAVDEANKSVLSYDTLASKAVQGMHKGIDNMANVPQQAKDVANAVIDVLAPFVRVPTAFLSRTIDYTPLGIPKTAIDQIWRGKFDQRQLSKAIGEGLTGTGVIALGVALSQSGQLSGDYPSSPKEQQRWKAEKIQPNSVKLGGTWISLNYLGPIGILFGSGKKFQESVATGGNYADAAGQAIAGFGQTLLGQSFLQGLSGFVDAAKDPSRYLENYVNGQAGSVVPAAVNDGANLSDNFQRQVNSPVDAIKNRIPGLRQDLNKKQDVYGNKLSQDPVNAAFNALRPSDDQTDNNPVLAEVNRLHGVDTSNTDLQVTPTQVDKSIKVNGSKYDLTDQQRYDLQEKIGQTTQQKWGELIQTPKYQALSDEDKAAALTSLRIDATKIAQNSYVLSAGITSDQNKLSSRQKNLESGASSAAKYAKASGTGNSSTTEINDSLGGQYKKTLANYDDMSEEERNKKISTENDAEYKYKLAKAENDRLNGKLSRADLANTKTELAKAKVGSSYSKDTRDFHSLSKSELSNIIKNEPDGDKIAEQVLAYDDALTAAGVQSKNKFRNSKGAVAIDPTAKSTGTGSRGGKSGGKKYSIDGYLSASKTSKSLRDILKQAKVTKAKKA